MREIGDRVEQRVDIRFVQALGEVFVLQLAFQVTEGRLTKKISQHNLRVEKHPCKIAFSAYLSGGR